MERTRETELRNLGRELIYLQSNLQKKQKKLARDMAEKDAQIAARDKKIEELTQRLEEKLPMPPTKSGLETPESTNSSSSSSEDDICKVPKFEIKPPLRSKRADIMLPPPLPPPRPSAAGRFRRRQPPSRGHGADEAFICTPSVS